MPSFQDSAFIFLLALILFGPKKLPELARQLGKLMGEFRRASNEFRMQMDDELRVAEQAERQKEIAAIASAAPVMEPLPVPAESSVAPPLAPIEDPMDLHPHTASLQPKAIATAGDLSLMPPSTGLPVARTASNSDLTPVLQSIPYGRFDALSSEVESVTPPDRTTSSSEPQRSAETLSHG